MFPWSRPRSNASNSVLVNQGAALTKEEKAADVAKTVLKTLLQVVVEVSDAFGPLQSVANGLNFIVKNIEKVGDNTAAMQKLLRRVKKIEELTKREDHGHGDECPVQCIYRDLDAIMETLDPIAHQNAIERFVRTSQNAALIQEYISSVEQALYDYQLTLVQGLQKLGTEQIGYAERNALDKLTRAKNAGFDASNHRSRCLAGTRTKVLHTLQQWAEDPDGHQVYWLNGHAGSGKSTIAQSFAEMLLATGDLGASFFCSRDSQQQSDLKTIFPTLAFQLATANNTDSPRYRRALLHALEKHPDIALSSLHNQLEELIIGPAQTSGITAIIVVDALDECRDPNSTSIILDLFASSIVRVPLIKIFITGRPEPHILSGFCLPQLVPITDVMILHEIDDMAVNADIRLFLQDKLSKIAEDRRRNYGTSIPSNWPSDSALDALTKKTAGLFIFASTVVKVIENTYYDPRDQLQKVLANTDDSSYEGGFGLDNLYLNILDGASPRHDDGFLVRLRSTLGLLTITNDALLPSTIAKLLGLPRSSDVRIILSSLRSLLVIPDDWSLPVCFHHQSFPDFLTDPARCTDPRFFINRDDHHFAIGQRCLIIMRGRLKKNICDLSPYAMNDTLDVALRDKRIGDATRYCCRYWANHLLSDVKRDSHLHMIEPLLLDFLSNQQLQWFEALGLLQELGRAVEALSDVRAWISTCSKKYRVLLEWIVEGQRFVLYAFDVISVSVIHIYHSALPFSPKSSLMRKRHISELSNEARVEVGTATSWKQSLRTIQLPGAAQALEYSHDGAMLAVGGQSICRIIRSATGQNIMDLDPSGAIQSLSFSPDDTTLATASNKHLRVWDVRTGAIIAELLHGETTIQHIEFHPAIKHLLLSKDNEGTVRLWDLEARHCQHTFEFLIPVIGGSLGCRTLCWLKGSSKKAILLAHSTHAELLIASGELPRRLRTYPYPQSINIQSPTIVSSEDGLSIALGSKSGSIAVYDVKSGALTYSISSHYKDMRFLQLLPSHDGRGHTTTFAFATGPSVCLLYGNQHPSSRAITLNGHADDVVSVASSSDGQFIASGSRDKTVRIWETRNSARSPCNPTIKGDHSHAIESGRLSNDGLFAFSISFDGTVKVWDTRGGTCCCTLAPSEVSSHSISRRHRRAAAILPGNEYLVTVEPNGVGKMWNLAGKEVSIWSNGPITSNNDFSEKVASTWLLPWGNEETLFGFFYCTCAYTRTSRLKKGAFRTQVECWTLHREASEPQPRMVLASSGEVPYEVKQIHHRADISSKSTTLTLHTKYGDQFTAVLWDYVLFSRSCQGLQFVREARRPADDIEGIVVGSETPYHKLVDHDTSWVIDEEGRRILWIPPDHDGPGTWQRDKLLLESRSGCLTVIDFSRTKLRDKEHSQL
ncbi:WD40-repeat-containing domain protein [Irpex rosettiformis]|uniref:WD40-repeat-containing domain protein n=1 Tax=Irpex rosettiformis TaxID=378272 RepID=A0ACB8TR94_9APHY|nr:WD40-repeat-containing domain protein [Irpex rosettiformis]